jgi:microsomal epoxide hydrolase
MLSRARLLGLLLLGLLPLLLLATPPARAADRWFTTSDGVRLHYIEQGSGRTIVMVPGWTMPAWIFAAQIAAFSGSYHVVALDPRGQGDSDVPAHGYEPFRRGQDIAELIDRLGPRPVLLMGWSLGVLDALSYLHQFGDSRVAGLVLVDNSVGEDPAPARSRATAVAWRRRGHPRPLSREQRMHQFVRRMFDTAPSADYIDRLTEATLRTPAWAASALLSYPVPRSFWREAIYSTGKPVLYMVRPGLAGQAANLEAHHPDTDSVVVQGVGHAMFVDDPDRFDSTVESFIRRRIWS